jgi:pimeloyl-ACP methyl ester carboxylesterase
VIGQGKHFLKVGGIETFVNVVGHGTPLIVVHGGPGFSHEYLVDPLASLAKKRTLIFYDQPGCGQTSIGDIPPSPALTFSHFCSLANLIDDGVHPEVLAHSWGTLVVLGAFAQLDDPPTPAPEISKCLFINPVAATSAKFEMARLNFLGRIPENILGEIEKAAYSNDDGRQIMDLILPYYYTNIDSRPDGPFDLTKHTYLSVNAQLTDFDYSKQIIKINNLSLLVGEDDFTTIDLINEMVSAAVGLHVMKSTGHFPFYEEKKEFEGVLGQIFG